MGREEPGSGGGGSSPGAVASVYPSEAFGGSGEGGAGETVGSAPSETSPRVDGSRGKASEASSTDRDHLQAGAAASRRHQGRATDSATGTPHGASGVNDRAKRRRTTGGAMSSAARDLVETWVESQLGGGEIVSHRVAANAEGRQQNRAAVDGRVPSAIAQPCAKSKGELVQDQDGGIISNGGQRRQILVSRPHAADTHERRRQAGAKAEVGAPVSHSASPPTTVSTEGSATMQLGEDSDRKTRRRALYKRRPPESEENDGRTGERASTRCSVGGSTWLEGAQDGPAAAADGPRRRLRRKTRMEPSAPTSAAAHRQNIGATEGQGGCRGQLKTVKCTSSSRSSCTTSQPAAGIGCVAGSGNSLLVDRQPAGDLLPATGPRTLTATGSRSEPSLA